MARLQKQERLTTSGDRIGVRLGCYKRGRKRQEGSKELELHGESEEPECAGELESQLEGFNFYSTAMQPVESASPSKPGRPRYTLDIHITDHAVTVRSSSKDQRVQDEKLGERAESCT